MSAVPSAAPEETASPPAEAAEVEEAAASATQEEAAEVEEGAAKRTRFAVEFGLDVELADLEWDPLTVQRDWHMDQLAHIEAGALIVSS